MNKPLKYTCPKCGHRYYDMGQIRAAGSFLAKIFDVQNRKFTSITCKRCTYTEFFAAKSSTMGSVFDFFTN